MGQFEALRDELRRGTVVYERLDAAQLVKHAFGLVTQARVMGKSPVLFYLFAEPWARAGKRIPEAAIEQHRSEAADFSRRVSGAAVRFQFGSYREWLAGFCGSAQSHASALAEAFQP